jgi:hypothetical protein
MGAKIAMQASAKHATMSKDRFIAVSLFRCMQMSRFCEPLDIRGWFQPVCAGRENGFVQWHRLFRGP